MSDMGRRFRSSELEPDAGPGPSDAEIAQAMIAARELETLTELDTVGPSVGFEERVMTAIAAEPAPRLRLRSAQAVRGGFPVAFLLSVRDAWRLATGGGRPLAIRAQAMAFVLLVVLATGSFSTVIAVGAASFLSSGPSPSPTLPGRTAHPTVGPTQNPTDGLAPTTTPSPSPSDGQTTEPTATDEPGETAEPTETDEAGGPTGPGDTAKPTRTPRATETHEPEETDQPDETDDPGEPTDDHGGGSGGGGSGGGDSAEATRAAGAAPAAADDYGRLVRGARLTT